MTRVFLFLSLYLSQSALAQAHWGHVGEIAGHAHWIGVGAVIVAGALAGLIGLLKDDETTAEGEDTGEDVSEGEIV